MVGPDGIIPAGDGRIPPDKDSPGILHTHHDRQWISNLDGEVFGGDGIESGNRLCKVTSPRYILNCSAPAQ